MQLNRALIIASIRSFIYVSKCRALHAPPIFPEKTFQATQFRHQICAAITLSFIFKLPLEICFRCPHVIFDIAYKIHSQFFKIFKKLDVLVCKRFRANRIPNGFGLICNILMIPQAPDTLISASAMGHFVCVRFTTAHFQCVEVRLVSEGREEKSVKS